MRTFKQLQDALKGTDYTAYHLARGYRISHNQRTIKYAFSVKELINWVKEECIIK